MLLALQIIATSDVILQKYNCLKQTAKVLKMDDWKLEGDP